jgi:hypothetical protein
MEVKDCLLGGFASRSDQIDALGLQSKLNGAAYFNYRIHQIVTESRLNLPEIRHVLSRND